MPFSARLYLSIAPAPSPDEIRKVGQWRAKEGCSTGTLEAGRAAGEVVVERWEDGCVRKIPACALNQAPGTCNHGLISCYAAPHTRLIVMAVECEHGQLRVKEISHLKKGRCFFFQALGLLAYLSK